MNKSHLRAIVAKTVRRFNAQYVGRAFAVPAYANFNSPAACDPLPPLGQRGEGATANSPTVAPAFDQPPFHSQPNSTGAR